MVKELMYTSYVEWTEKKKAKVRFEPDGKDELIVAVAPEFMGHSGLITPEDLFVSSVNTCMMSYFLNVAERMRCKFNSYSSKAIGTLSESGVDFVFSKVELVIHVTVPNDRDLKRAERAIAMAREGCFIANSIRPQVTINHSITTPESNL